MTYFDNAGRKKGPTNQNLYDYYADLHPKTESQWRDQQNLTGIPYIGSIYNDWMVGRSTNERNDRTRSLFGFSNVSADYPWLSGINDKGVDSRALGQLAVATAIPSIMGLYASEKKKYRPKRRASWSEYGYN